MNLNPYEIAHQNLAKAASPPPSPFFTLGGYRWVLAAVPGRGIVLQKAGRRRVAPGQLGLFAPDTPKEGATKVERGITYRLNRNSRWERADKPPAPAKQKLQVLQAEPADPAEAERQKAIAAMREIKAGNVPGISFAAPDAQAGSVTKGDLIEAGITPPPKVNIRDKDLKSAVLEGWAAGHSASSSNPYYATSNMGDAWLVGHYAASRGLEGEISKKRRVWSIGERQFQISDRGDRVLQVSGPDQAPQVTPRPSIIKTEPPAPITDSVPDDESDEPMDMDVEGIQARLEGLGDAARHFSPHWSKDSREGVTYGRYRSKLLESIDLAAVGDLDGAGEARDLAVEASFGITDERDRAYAVRLADKASEYLSALREIQPDPPPQTTSRDTSDGHIGFDGDWEYYRSPSGDVFRANRADPVMPDGRRSGRFHGTGAAWQHDPLNRKMALESPEGIYLGREILNDDGVNWDKGNAVILAEYRIRKSNADDHRRMGGRLNQYLLERRHAHRNDVDGLVPRGDWGKLASADSPDTLLSTGSATRLDEVEDPVLKQQYDRASAAATAAKAEAERKRAETESQRVKEAAEHEQWMTGVREQYRATRGKKQDISVQLQHRGEVKTASMPATVYGDIAVHKHHLYIDGEMRPARAGGYRVTHVASGKSLHDADTLEDARMAAIAFHHGVEWQDDPMAMPKAEIAKARDIKIALSTGTKPPHVDLNEPLPMRDTGKKAKKGKKAKDEQPHLGAAMAGGSTPLLHHEAVQHAATLLTDGAITKGDYGKLNTWIKKNPNSTKDALNAEAQRLIEERNSKAKRNRHLAIAKQYAQENPESAAGT
ncbi:MAG: hypothetical protein O2890_12700, partial [Cyanobacteria bacterium]|nr:hypothetical protein [Cyanobacteriota bacterium]